MSKLNILILIIATIMLSTLVNALELDQEVHLEDRTNKVYRFGQSCCPGCSYVKASCCCAPAISITKRVGSTTKTLIISSTETETATEYADVTVTSTIQVTSTASSDVTLLTTITSTSLSTQVTTTTDIATTTIFPSRKRVKRQVLPAHICPVCSPNVNPLPPFKVKSNPSGSFAFCCPKKRPTITITRGKTVTAYQTEIVTETETETVASTIFSSATEVLTTISLATTYSTISTQTYSVVMSTSTATCNYKTTFIAPGTDGLDLTNYVPSFQFDYVTPEYCFLPNFPVTYWQGVISSTNGTCNAGYGSIQIVPTSPSVYNVALFENSCYIST